MYKAYRKTGLREVVAVKCIPRAKLAKSMHDALITEITTMRDMRHDHIVHLVDHRWDKAYIYLIMEFCGGGDLSKVIKARRKLPESDCKRFLQQVASAMRYLREHNISHMDLKPANLLIAGGRRAILKVADFGFAMRFDEDEKGSSLRGSPLYMAPEIVRGKYDARADLWSIGVILFETLFGQAPFKSETREEVYQKLKEDTPITIPRGSGISEACRDLLTRCLERDPEKRISFQDFFEHPFLDLEHMPSQESEAKAMDLVHKAEAKERRKHHQEALDLYREALDYLVPLVKSRLLPETKCVILRQKTLGLMEKAEELKATLSGGEGGSAAAASESRPQQPPAKARQVQRLQQRDSAELSKFDELLALSAVTPKLKTGLEIARTAEDYELELKYQERTLNGFLDKQLEMWRIDLVIFSFLK